jgi:hypothetical protein
MKMYGEVEVSIAILDLSTRWRWMVSFMPPLPGKNPRYPLDRRLGGPQNQSGCCGIEKNLLPLLGIISHPSSL